jgi:hypothetical protein
LTAREVWRWTDERGVQRLVGTDELRSALASSVLPASTLVWREGMKEWAPASSLPELASAAFAAGSDAGANGASKADEGTFDARSTQSRRATLVGGVSAPSSEGAAGPPVPVDVPSSERGERPGVTQIPPFGAPKPEVRVPKVPASPMIPTPRPPVAEPRADRPYRKIATSEIDSSWATITHSDEDETLPRSRPSQLAAAAAAAAEAAASMRDVRAKQRAEILAKRAGADALKASPSPVPRASATSAARPEIVASPAMPAKRKPPPLPPRSTRKPPPPPPVRAAFASGPLGVPVKPVIPAVPQVGAPVRIKPPAGASSDPGRSPLTTTLPGIASPFAVPSPDIHDAGDKPAAQAADKPEKKRPGSVTLVSAQMPAPAAEGRAATPPRAPDSDRAPPLIQTGPLGLDGGAPGAKPDGAPAPPRPRHAPPRPPRPHEPSPSAEAEHAESGQKAPVVAAQTPEPPVATAVATQAQTPEPPAASLPLPPSQAASSPSSTPATSSTPAPSQAAPSQAAPSQAAPSQAAPSSQPVASSSAASLPLPPSSVQPSSARGAPSSRAPASVAILRRKPERESEMTRLTRVRPEKRPRRGLAQHVPVPISSLLGAGGVLIGMVVAAFFAGRASAVPPPRPGARSGMRDLPLRARAAIPPPPKPCWMTKQPAKWADQVYPRIPFELVATSDRALAIGYAEEPQVAVGIEVDLATGEVKKRFEEKGDERIERILPVSASEYHVARAGASSALKTPIEVAEGGSFAVGKTEASIAIASPPTAAPLALWPLAGEDALNAASVHGMGQGGYLLLYRRAGAIWGGFIDGDRKAVGDLTKIAGLSLGPGRPASGWNGREIAVVFADREEGSPWQLRIGHAAPPSVPTRTETFVLPKGGPGNDAFSPDIAGLPRERWLLMWTEGTAGSRAVRAQTLTSSFTPLGDPIALSPPAGNFGQGTIGVAGGYAANVFLQKGASGYELWGAVLQCN